MKKIVLLCNNLAHPVVPYLKEWADNRRHRYHITLAHDVTDLKEQGHILFLVSCSQLVTAATRALFDYTLVLHASDLPNGRGWSPHVWEVAQGKNEITLSLLNAEDKVDTGSIWKKEKLTLSGYELYDEINHKLFLLEVELLDWAAKNIEKAVPQPQEGEPSYYRKRTLEDSKLDVNKTLIEQFNLLRVCDSERFPAFFEIDGNSYTIKIERK